MKTFEEWLVRNHPEMIEEGWMQKVANSRTVRNLVAGAGLAAGGLGTAGKAPAGEAVPKAAAQDSRIATAEAEYDFDDNESIRDAVEEATMQAKAKIAKMYGTDVLSGVGRPVVKVDRKSRKVFVTVTASKQAAGSAPAAKTPSKNAPSVEKRVSKSAF